MSAHLAQVFKGRRRAGRRILVVTDAAGGSSKAIGVIVLLFITLGSIVATDWLAAVVAQGGVNIAGGRWWGARQESPWADAVSVNHGLRLTSRELLITVNGDSLVARYTVSAPTGSILATQVLADQDNNAGNDLVNNVLGAVQVAQFRYGFTGSHYSWSSLTFRRPQLSINGRIAAVTVDSDPFRLYLKRQEISVAKSSGAIVEGADLINIKAPSVQVSSRTGAVASSLANGAAVLHPTRGTITATVSETDAGQGWLDGLRSVGGTEIPVADGLLFRLGNLFIYLVLLWSFYKASRQFPFWRPVAVSRKAVLTIVIGLSAIAFLGFAFDVSTALFRNPNQQGYIAAGPLGLLAGGVALAWPAACLRIGSGTRPAGSRLRPARRTVLIAILAHATVVLLYWIVLYRLGISAGSTAKVVAATAAVTILIPLVVRQLFGGRSVMAWLVSAGMLAAVLAATFAWPLLWYEWVAPYWSNYAHVNVVGKWIYMALAVLTVTGLCIISVQVVRAMMGQGHRQWQRVAAAAIAAGIVLAVLPDAAFGAGLADAHAVGFAPVDLFNLFDALPSLLDWLLLALAVLLVIRLPTAPDPRPAARCIAAPIALMVLYWNDKWLYLPVTLTVGLVMVVWLLLPKELADISPRPEGPEKALRKAIADWQRAEFAAGQRQALAAASADALRDYLIKDDAQGYNDAFARLAQAQEDLAAKHDAYQGEAHAAKVAAFDHRGEMLDRQAGKAGLIVGAVLGIVPATVILLTTQPPPGTGTYPVLAFLGNTAWNVLPWAVLGWFIGYFLPLMRGGNGAEKAMWMFITGAAASLPASIIWYDNHDWAFAAIYDLELFTFLVLTTIVVDDIRTLTTAGMRATDWVRVHNWRFVVTWSAALIAAVGTALATFLSTAATDLSHQTVTVITGPSRPTTSPGH